MHTTQHQAARRTLMRRPGPRGRDAYPPGLRCPSPLPRPGAPVQQLHWRLPGRELHPQSWGLTTHPRAPKPQAEQRKLLSWAPKLPFRFSYHRGQWEARPKRSGAVPRGSALRVPQAESHHVQKQQLGFCTILDLKLVGGDLPPPDPTTCPQPQHAASSFRDPGTGWTPNQAVNPS